MLTGLIGNGAALIIGAIALLGARYRHDIRGRYTHEIVLTAAIVLMAFSGELTRSTGIGHWLTSVITWVQHLIGKDASTVIAVITLGVLVILARHIVKTAAASGLWLAFALPFLLATFPVGAFHTLDVALQKPAIELATQLSSALGVS